MLMSEDDSTVDSDVAGLPADAPEAFGSNRSNTNHYVVTVCISM